MEQSSLPGRNLRKLVVHWLDSPDSFFLSYVCFVAIKQVFSLKNSVN
ncbi:hypothetical protein S1OALGB6SA_368 [Olavius algarvensis spirochete endosymbiont]|nr:hypothetical protein S1OALGB6SA_368 [Olavius algarvensis spirochete endosymbiont]